MSDSVGFSSVKLPAALVQQAREAAQAMRRSLAGQIEYWATLGRIAEHTGLGVREAQTAIESYEAAALQARVNRIGAAERGANDDGDLQAIKRRVLAVNADGSLQAQVRLIVKGNRRLARPRTAA